MRLSLLSKFVSSAPQSASVRGAEIGESNIEAVQRVRWRFVDRVKAGGDLHTPFQPLQLIVWTWRG